MNEAAMTLWFFLDLPRQDQRDLWVFHKSTEKVGSGYP